MGQRGTLRGAAFQLFSAPFSPRQPAVGEEEGGKPRAPVLPGWGLCHLQPSVALPRAPQVFTSPKGGGIAGLLSSAPNPPGTHAPVQVLPFL